MSATTDRLYNLLPVIYRLRDAEQGEPLRALLGIINGELSKVEADITGLYENWFIETSDEWVVAYIGDLLGVRGLNTLQTTAFSQRAYVANTLYYRRRKGTAQVIETLAGDVTGWPAQVVEFFQLLQTTQFLNHTRLFNTTPDLRNTNQLDLLDTPFDTLPHTGDVRHIYNRRGKHNIPNLGVFLWRLQNYPLEKVVARQAAAPQAYGYHFSPLGNPAPLFNAPATDSPDEQLVPAPIRPLDFYRDLKLYVEAENYNARSSPTLGAVAISDAGDSSQTGLATQPNEWTSYANIDLTGQASITLRYSNANAPTSLEIRIGSSTGRLLGACSLPMTTGWNDFKTVTCGITSVSGRQTIVLVYQADCVVYLNWFSLGRGLTSNPTENSRYYGPQRSLQIVKDGQPVPPKDILCKNLSDWAQPPKGKVAVDVERGRITFADQEEPKLDLIVSYNYGFSADIGGGPYDRRERLAEITPGVIAELQVGAGKTYATLTDALKAWADANKFNRSPAIIRIYDSATYDANLTVALPANGMLVIDCENEERPTLITATPPTAAPLTVIAEGTKAEQVAAFTLSGLIIEGYLKVSGKLNLTLTDCTLVPGQALDEEGYPQHPEAASLTVTGSDVADISISISRCIVGPLELPEGCQALAISDSIVDAPDRAAIAASADGADPGPPLTLNRVTIFGEVHVKELSLASEVIFVHKITADRRQTGCVRFSYVPKDSQTPRRFRCQPDLAIADREKELDPTKLSSAEHDEIVTRVRPQFTSLRYGEAAFAQLASACADEIKTGAEDGSEMGAFSLLQQPQREANLRIALEEYLRFGLEAGIFFVT